ncbi:MAG TPA: 3-deoxy-manno-octulosonate cytidylyltransferase [Steroidobacteraceae bacterium]|nr:3-deoxy-manno-octulosonate cytidylyltransferase [Steroidobacteraceae bacterium]
MFRVVIPARHASTRLPGKPLQRLAGEPMILHVHRLAKRAGAAEVVVATDDARIRDVCLAAGALVEMTDAGHVSGTDRIAEVAARRGWPGQDIVVNVQGDEPLLPPALVGQVAGLLASTRGAAIATLATPITNENDYLDPNVVKVVARPDGMALFFSRAPLPWDRDGSQASPVSADRHRGSRRHLGLYAYRVAALQALAAAPPAALEARERLEQLRALALGLPIVVADAVESPGPGVDTPDDLARAEAILSEAASR